MANKRSVLLNGTPQVNEEGACSAELRPGYLVQGVTTITVHNTAGENVPRAVALERDELGRGIDNTYQSADQSSAYYASGDRVKVAVLYPGCRATMFLASGYGVTADGQLQSHGDGTLRPMEASQAALFRSLETVVGSAAVVAVRVEAM